MHQMSLTYFIGSAVLAVFGLTMPSFALDKAIAKRKSDIGRRIPDFLDMVSTTVEAGIALNSALAIATASMKGPLAEELEMVLSDVRLGRNRADAFNSMAQRVHQVDLSSLVMAIVQTERLGGNIGHVLDELADEARSRRLQRAEGIAAALPVKMVLPMAFFMLPALFVMIFAPIVAELVGKR
jgi:tight adherence protein C